MFRIRPSTVLTVTYHQGWCVHCPSCAYFFVQFVATAVTYALIVQLQDWDVNSPLMQHRQHHPGGNAELTAMMNMFFHLPNRWVSTGLLGGGTHSCMCRITLPFILARHVQCSALGWLFAIFMFGLCHSK